MNFRHATYVFWTMLLGCIAFAHPALAQTRLGLHVTQEELNIWRQRMTDNLNTINGKTFQFIYQNRILSDANAFRSQSHPGGDGFWVGYTGAGCAPDTQNPGVGGTPFGHGNGAYMVKSAFNFLLTGNNTYADPVRTELLSIIGQSGLAWTNTAKWCTSSLQGTTNVLNVISWLNRLLVAFDYLLAGGYTGFSAGEITSIKQWMIDAGTVWSNANMVGIAAFGAYPGTHSTPQNLTCVGATCTNVQGALYQGGPNARQATANWFNNVSTGPVVFTMGIGLMTNTQSLIDYAVRWTTAFIKVGIWDDGATVDFRRWSDFSPHQPGGAWTRSASTINGVLATADMYARAGNTSLYDLSVPTQVLGGSGGTVSIQKAIELLGKMVNGTVVYLVGDGGQVLTWVNTLGHDYYGDFGSAVANLYYRNSHIKTAVERNLKAGSGDTSGDCFDPQLGGCFSGAYITWADIPFMFGKMEGKVNPYGGTTATPPPLGSGVTVDSTYTGWTTVPIDDGIINAAGGTASTWASADSATANHWINIALPLAQQINTATIYWAYNSFQQKYMTSQRVDVQYWNGSSYVTAATITYPGSDIPSSTVSFPAITTSQIRFYQAANQGNPTYPGVLWVTEVDYGTQTPTLASPPGDLRIISAQ